MPSHTQFTALFPNFKKNILWEEPAAQNVDICSPFTTWMKEHYQFIPSPACVACFELSSSIILPCGFKLIFISTKIIINSMPWWNFNVFSIKTIPTISKLSETVMRKYLHKRPELTTQIAKFMGPTWGPPGSCRPQMGPMLAPWTSLSG